MPLSDSELHRAFAPNGPWTATRDGKRVYAADLKIGPNSVDLSAAAALLQIQPRGACIDLHDPESFIATKCHCAGGFLLMPGQLYLAASRESFDTSAPLWIPQTHRWRESVTGHSSAMCCREQRVEVETYFVQGIEGRSTAARVGLSSHANAGFGDFGFGGNWVFELQVVFPTRIYAGDRVAQIYWAPLEGRVDSPYQSVYASQNAPTVAQLGVDRF